MFAYADLPPLPNNPYLLWERFYSVWQNEYLGFPLPESSFEVITGIIIFVLRDPILTQKFLLLSVMPCAIICMYFFVGHFIKSYKSRFLTSILYGFNPTIIGRFVNGGPLNVLYLYALLPLLWLQLIKILNERRIFDIFLFAIIFGIVGSNVHQIFWAVLPFVVSFIIFRLSKKKYRNKEFLLSIFLTFFSIFIGFLLVLPDILLILQRSENIISQFESLMSAVKWSYSIPTPLNLVRLAGNGGDLMMRYLNYNNNNFWNFCGLIIPLIAFPFSFLSKENRDYTVSFLTLSIAIMIFILLTRFGLTYPLFRDFQILFSLKNPVKLMYPMSLAICSLFGIGLDEITKKGIIIFQRKFHTTLLNALVFILILLYLYPVLGGGTVGLNEVYGDTYFIPTEYEKVFDWINKQRQFTDFFRTLWLPYDYSTQIRLWVADPYNVGVRSGAAWLNVPNINFVRNIFEKISEGNTGNFCEILKMLDVKYVIVDLNSDQIFGCMVVERRVTPWILGNAAHFIKFIEGQKDLEEVFRNKNFIIYENKKFEQKRISTYDSLIFLIPPLKEMSSTPLALTPNLLQNPEFEKDVTWEWFDNEHKRASIDDMISYEGRCSLRITNYDQDIWASLAQIISIEGGGTYHFSAWIRTEDVHDAHIKIVWFDKNEMVVRTDLIINRGEIEGTYDWFQISKVMKAPQNAATTSIRLVGGLSSDGETAAITWFDNIEFYEISPTISDSFISNFLSLSNVYGFNSSKHLVVFEKDFYYNEIFEILNISNIIVFSHPIKSQLIRYMSHLDNQTMLQIFEAETLPTTERSLILNNSMSNGKAIKINNGTASLEFYAPRSSYYKIGINGLFRNTSIFIDNINISIKNQHETNTKYLDMGYHILNIVSEEAILDQIQIISAISRKEIDNIFTSKSDLESRIENMKSMKDYFLIDLELEDPTFVVLRESYHKDWKLCTQNSVKNENFIHFKAFNWANAFYLPKTERITVKIEFKQQALRDLLIKIWVLNWFVIFSFFVYKSLRSKYFNAIYVKLRVAQKMINKFD